MRLPNYSKNSQILGILIQTKNLLFNLNRESFGGRAGTKNWGKVNNLQLSIIVKGLGNR